MLINTYNFKKKYNLKKKSHYYLKKFDLLNFWENNKYKYLDNAWKFVPSQRIMEGGQYRCPAWSEGKYLPAFLCWKNVASPSRPGRINVWLRAGKSLIWSRYFVPGLINSSVCFKAPAKMKKKASLISRSGIKERFGGVQLRSNFSKLLSSIGTICLWQIRLLIWKSFTVRDGSSPGASKPARLTFRHHSGLNVPHKLTAYTWKQWQDGSVKCHTSRSNLFLTKTAIKRQL